MDVLRQKRVEQEKKKTSGLKKQTEKSQGIPEFNSGPLDWNVGANDGNMKETLLQGGKMRSTSLISKWLANRPIS